jgi:hypothetical protein
MALWTKATLCVKSSLLEQSLLRTPSRPKTNQRQSAKSAFKIRVNPWLINDNCRETFTDVMSALQIGPFCSNKPNFRKSQMNVNKVSTSDYDKMDTWSIRKNEPKRTQNEPKFSPKNDPTNPNEPKTNPISEPIYKNYRPT